MVFEDIHKEEARGGVGDPEDASLTEVAGVAPPCSNCGTEEAVGMFDGRHLCDDCKPDDAGHDE